MGGSKELKAAISSVLAMVGGNAAAQSAGGSDADDSALQEVIVTATRRAERMQDIPESISAFSTDDIAKRWQRDRLFEPRMGADQREALYAGWQAAVARVRSAAA